MGTDTEAMIHEFCDKMQIPFEKISSEDLSVFLRILSPVSYTHLHKPLFGQDAFGLIGVQA